MDLIEEILKFGVKIAKLKPKDQCVNGAEMQGFNYNLPKDWTVKMKNVRDQNTKHRTGAVFPLLFIFFPTENGRPPPLPPLHLQLTQFMA